MIIQILLTIWAWNKGWAWKALIPLACAFGIGLMIGGVYASTNTPVPPGVIMIDVLADIALILMIIFKPTPKAIEVLKEEPKSTE